MTANKKHIPFVLIVAFLLLVGAGCPAKTSTETTADSGTTGREGVPGTPSLGMPSIGVNDNVSGTESDRDAASGRATGKVEAEHVIKITASQFNFTPAEIRVKLGENVRLEIASVDVDHGISLPAFNVSAAIKAKTTTKVEFTADKKGSFPFFCNVFCGSGHGGMRGTLIVE